MTNLRGANFPEKLLLFAIATFQINSISFLGISGADFLIVFAVIVFASTRKMRMQESNRIVISNITMIVFVLVMQFTEYIGSPYVQHNFNALLSVFRFAFGLMIITFIFPQVTDVRRIIYYVKNVSIIATILIIIQQSIFTLTGRALQFNMALILNANTEVVSKFGIDKWGGLHRPAAFFAEPSHLAIYISMYLYSTIFTESKQQSLKLRLFLSLGIVISQSTTGYGLLGMYWLIVMFNYVKNNKGISTKILYLFPVVITIVFIVFNSAFMKNVITRTFSNPENSSITGRLYGWDIIGYVPGELYNKIIGYGYGFTDTFLPAYGVQIFTPGWLLLFMSFGWIGIILYSNILLAYLAKYKNIWFFLVIIIGSFFATTIFSYYTVLFIGMWIASSKLYATVEKH